MNIILETRKDNFKEKFYYLLENYDLWLWDFDLTLTKIHTYKNKMNSYLVGRKRQRDLENDFWDANFFINFVNYLVLSNKKVAIVSFGSFNVIKTYLQRLFGNNYIFNSKNILTPLVGDSKYGEQITQPPNNKNQMITKISKQYQINLSRTIFFDDTLHNIYQAKTLGIMSVYVPPEKGFNSIYLENIEDKFRNLLEEGKIITLPYPSKKETIDVSFTDSIVRFREEDSLPDFRDDLENNKQIFLNNHTNKQDKIEYDEWTQYNKQNFGIEGINLPFEKNLNKYNDPDPIIENFNNNFTSKFENNYNNNNYWIWLQKAIEIIAILLFIWFLYNKYLS